MNAVRSFSGMCLVPNSHHHVRGKLRASAGQNIENECCLGLWVRRFGILVLATGWIVSLAPIAMGSHGGHEGHSTDEQSTSLGPGHPIPGASFKVFLDNSKVSAKGEGLAEDQAADALRTVIEALSSMTQNRTQYQRFDEALSKNALQKVVIEPQVFNREGQEFPFLVARTKHKGKVKLLISAKALNEKGYLNNPDKLVPVLAREFQWVLIKADTTPKRKMVQVKRDLLNAPIKTNKEIQEMSVEARDQVLQKLFQTYLTTVDDLKSLNNQPAYEIGSTTLMQPTQPDSTTKLYDIRVRAALQMIVRDPYFQEHTPKAVKSLLNGKIWNVSFAKIDDRDWATRTRVLPSDKAVAVGKNGRTIQPAKILVNVYRMADPEDPFYSLVNGLPMGAQSADQLARVIALEIQNNITDKSMRGHVAQDEITTPK